MQWLGDISMTFYMVHMMVLFLVAGVAAAADPSAPGEERGQPFPSKRA